MPLFPINPAPGVYNNGTPYQASGRWNASRLVRFFDRAIGPFGGWRHMAVAATGDGPGRGILCWRANSFAKSAMFGTPNKLYVWDGDNLINVTPAGFPAGVVDSFAGVGYGFGPYGMGPYGVSSGSAAFTATTWALDNWGSNVLALASHDGVLREYKNNGLAVEVVANAPTARSMFVTEERTVVLLGAGGDMRYAQWSDHENHTLYTPAPTNAAGDWLFQTAGTLVTGRRARGTNLIWTTTELWSMRFIGGTLVYEIKVLAPNCGLVAPLAVQVIDSGAVWMGQKNFYILQGGQVVPLESSLQDYVFGDINFDQAAKFHCGHVSAFGEVLFFYCSANSNAINRCVAYNYRKGIWYIVDPDGVMARGCWFDVGAFAYPLAVGEDGKLYEQESGWTANGTPITTGRYVRGGPFEIGNGDQLIEANELIPDDKTFGQMRVKFRQRFAPGGVETTRGPYTIGPYTPIRLTARQVEMELEATADADFRFGTQRLLGEPGGQR